MFAWLLDHPASNLFARQLPVAGLDSKWLEAHTALRGDRFGVRVRREQERIGWDRAWPCLRQAAGVA